ncbi:DUF2207 domain-containing protein [Rathayibacter sp. VKM Ac-2835]|uniref:DUF2207 family protein n=1 Tax=Rathayibacter sp. VKM Ac-2835 TaxID=2739043 RepID=UPI0015646314|nr:DUF2207 domain-containing protein [Rathayibacter sp. VKM Ac-2835]NRG41254.1 DUF2207 domain-containing protein [Rathayibacter sp. VKM Ac-2835]
MMWMLGRLLSATTSRGRGSGERGAGLPGGAAVVLLLAALAGAPAATAGPLAAVHEAEPVAAAFVGAAPVGGPARGVDDFRFSRYAVDYDLGRDAEGRSTLTTVETFVAEFPEDQNRGMQRAIPLEYQGYPTGVDLVSVTDGEGRTRPVDTETEDGILLVTSAADGFVSGSQTYVFTYTQHDVTLPGSGTRSGEDEFYWDANGTQWRQPFDRYDVRIRLADGLAEAATGTSACYRGAAGSTDGCSIGRDGAVVTASGTDLAAYENVTVAVGFAPGTFTPRDDGYFASAWAWVQLGSLLVLLGVLVAAVHRRATVLRDAPGRPTVIAEYEPPAQGLFLSAALRGRSWNAPAAALLDAAVRGLVRVEEKESAKGGSAKKPAFLLRVLDPATASPRRAGRPRAIPPVDREFFDIAFGAAPRPGEVRDLSEKDKELGKAVSAFQTGMSKRVTQEGLRRPGTVRGSVLLALLAVVASIGAVLGGALLLVGKLGGPLPFVLVLVAVALGAAICVLLAKVPLTAAGAELRDHLKGLTLYLRLAEADRFAMLQSPRGADRRSVGPIEVVEVTERLLPWAVLLGLEKEWSAALASAYEQTGESPGWYAGRNGFQTAAFAGSVASFSSSASSYVGSSSSSSSGGAGGGGSSGGGGGGGGGGGV